jgi:hypothetical protein
MYGLLHGVFLPVYGDYHDSLVDNGLELPLPLAPIKWLLFDLQKLGTADLINEKVAVL